MNLPFSLSRFFSTRLCAYSFEAFFLKEGCLFATGFLCQKSLLKTISQRFYAGDKQEGVGEAK
ncbi:hypothetical protein DC20_00675 [Rufibacter tibetensis]|uniref:Uncharacterized protein n=1 Tax=Rufibacter tibetensis TaxID=512763 RepID=A0A0P0C8U5_9BACT|nr:hypothetical protein DC20_00675 [Rufibacter tibetensis]